VYLPGEPEAETRARRLREGVPVDSVTWDYFTSLSRKLGISQIRSR
jgi:LDH2 family malate/lactate/ureidoglycolate dehydrogenase